MLFGAHVSVADGYLSALEYAQTVGCECAQIFAKSPRQWRGKAVDPTSAASFIEARTQTRFGPVFTHTAYLINLATDNAALRDRSIKALADELVRGALLQAEGVVCHVGSDPGEQASAAAERVADSVVRAFELADASGGSSRLLLENTAGAGRAFGSSFEELGAAIRRSDMPAERLGLCFDTCHAFAYGMPVDSKTGWAETLARLDSVCGIERLGLIHANDCLFGRGSRRDRHAWIGEGMIGEEGFLAMVCSRELRDVPVCIEMPGDIPTKDTVNLTRLKSLRQLCAESHSSMR